MKPMMALFLSLALLIAGLAGCTQTAAPAESTAAPSPTAGPTPAASSEEASASPAPAESSAAAPSSSEPTPAASSEAPEATEAPKAQYDRSEEHDAAVLSDGDALVGGTYTATGEDESVLEASGDVTATVTGSLLQKASGSASSADGSSFYGLNAGVRVYGGAAVTLTDCEIQADAENATGVFAYDGGVITLEDCTVTVTGGGAGGVQVAGGGTLYGKNLTVTSASKAAIRSDRGGGLLVIDGGIYTATGTNGCPAIYSTAQIEVSNAQCVSTNSRAVIIEGKNSVTLENCTLSGQDQSSKEGSVRANVLLYQSMSGDASEGVSTFTMNGGAMTCNSGAMFYCTNTSSVINLHAAQLVLSPDGTLLIVSRGRWGRDGANGGDCSLNAESQTLEGDILVDEISSLALNLSASSYTGAITGEGTVTVELDSGSTWTLTGDSAVTALAGDLSGIHLNGYRLTVNGELWTGA